MLMSARLSIHDLMFIIQNVIRSYILHHYCDTPIWILVAKAMFEVEKNQFSNHLPTFPLVHHYSNTHWKRLQT